MLNNSSTVIGTNLAEVLVDTGIRLVPKANTLLSELNGAIKNNLLQFPEINDKDMIPGLIQMGSTGTAHVVKGEKTYEQSPHDTFMDNYIEDLARLVSGYISFSRNVVNKEVNLLKEEMTESLNSYKYKEPEDFFSINYFKLNSVYESYLVTTEVGGYKDSSNKYFFEQMPVLSGTGEGFSLSGYLVTGDADQDAVIAGWLGTIGEERALSYITTNVREYELSTDQLLDYALVNYIFYRNLTERKDLDMGLTTAGLQSKASSNRDYFGNKLYIALELYRKDIRNGRLLSSNSNLAFSYFNDSPLLITIYEENLVKLAEAGLSIDVLFGYISGGVGGSDVTVDYLIQNAEKYLAKWNNTRSLYLISVNSSRLDVFKQLLRTRFEASLSRAEVDSDEQEYLTSNAGFLEETKKLGNAYIDTLDVSEIDDLCTITLVLVAKIRYRFTNSYFILKEMQEILAMSDRVEPMEAALYATIKYVTDYLVESVDCSKM